MYVTNSRLFRFFGFFVERAFLSDTHQATTMYVTNLNSSTLVLTPPSLSLSSSSQRGLRQPPRARAGTLILFDFCERNHRFAVSTKYNAPRCPPLGRPRPSAPRSFFRYFRRPSRPRVGPRTSCEPELERYARDYNFGCPQGWARGAFFNECSLTVDTECAPDLTPRLPASPHPTYLSRTPHVNAKRL